MKTIEGHYLNGRHPVPLPARLDFDGSRVTLTTDTISENFSETQLLVSPRVAASQRFISFPGGTQFLCPDGENLDVLPQESPSEGIVAWLENRWKIALASVITIAVLLVCGYLFGLPVAAKSIAAKIPMETEHNLGVEVLAWFDSNEWLKSSGIAYDRREIIGKQFYGICQDLPYREHYRLEYRKGGVFGANAFALPGGIVVLTDELVNAADTDSEVIAVLAHEIGHVELRHSLRTVLQNSIIGAAITTVTADAATLSVAVASLPAVLAQTRYSREFETEADEFAFELLKKHGYSPAAFASILETMDKNREGTPSFIDYFSTHPLTGERIQRARDAALEKE